MTVLRLEQLVDRSTFRPDGTVGMSGTIVRGARAVAEQVARALLTDKGELRHAENVGINLERLRKSRLGPSDLARYRSAIVAEARAVEFVRDAQATLGFLTGPGTLKLVLRLLLVDGKTYPLAVTIDEAGRVLASFGGTTA